MNDVTEASARWDFAAVSPTRIVTVEGLDGSGKTTFASLLVGYLNECGIPTGTARLPTDLARNLPMFETFRQIKPDYDPDRYDPLAMQAFLMADRLHYMRTAFNRLSQQYLAVVFDRYLLSGAAHLVVDGHPIGGWFKDLCSYLPQPAEMFYLRAPYDVARSRIRQRKDELTDQFDERRFLLLQQASDKLAAVNQMKVVDTSKTPVADYPSIFRTLELRLRCG